MSCSEWSGDVEGADESHDDKREPTEPPSRCSAPAPEARAIGTDFARQRGSSKDPKVLSRPINYPQLRGDLVVSPRAYAT